MKVQDNTLEQLVGFIRFYEERNPEIIDGWKKEIDKSGIGTVLNFALRKDHEERAMYYYVTKFFWIILRYGGVENFKGIRQWRSYNIDNENIPGQMKLNSAKSIRELFNYLKTKLTNEELQNIEFENIIFGNGKSKEITTTVINGIKSFGSNAPNKESITGFSCPLHPKTVEEIFNLMFNHLPKPQIEGKLEDFKAIFSEKPVEVKEPVKWLIKSQKAIPGHQTKLYLFIETMLNGEFSAKDKRKAVDLFIDEKGKFFNPKMKEPNKNDRDTHNIFENLIKEAKEKTQPV